ncbi:MAG TPA: curli production assembly/transport component CsgF [Bacteroidetes bacterium]|nr:curli production assembly/transport component CsgF [Bacteroidota bacterium]
MKPVYAILLFFFCCAMGSRASAQDMVYKPKNPAFGGDTFNYNWLLSSAQIQDLTEDPNRVSLSSSRNSADAFAENLNSLLLSQLSRQIINNQFGENGFTDGTFELGDFQIDVATTLEGLTITVFDIVKGDQTQIVIPFF